MTSEASVTSIFIGVQTWGWVYVIGFVICNIMILIRIAYSNIHAGLSNVGFKGRRYERMTYNSSLRGLSDLHGTILTEAESQKVSHDEGFCQLFTNFFESSFSYSGHVPMWQAAAMNALLFLILRKRIAKMFTGAGVPHAFALGSLLWSTVGWRWWSVCSCCLFVEHYATMVNFKQKEEAGLIDELVGRKSPERIW